MTIVLTGGGSGGHITPILAVADELKRLRPDIQLVYVGQKGDSLGDIPAHHPSIDAVYTVRAGKFRRYSNMTARQQLFDFKTQFLNLRDLLYIAIGLWQSYWLMRRLRPTVVFTRGGYVSVPVAMGGKLRHVPYITHDSDSTPSLANRLIARWARLHAVALPAELYPYPKAKTVTVGVPVSESFQPVTPVTMAAARQRVKLAEYKQVILLTGGGNGAGQLNLAMAAAAAELLAKYPRLAIVHMTGRSLEEQTSKAYRRVLQANEMKRITIIGFTTDLVHYSAAADLIVARGGATNLAEFAIQRKACLIIPAKFLPWQAHHTATLAEQGAVVTMSETTSEQPHELAAALTELLEAPANRQALADNLARFAYPHAAHDLANLLLEIARS